MRYRVPRKLFTETALLCTRYIIEAAAFLAYYGNLWKRGLWFSMGRPLQHPGESPTYILRKIKHRTRANDISCKTEYRTFSPQKPYWYYYTNVSDVPRSLQS